jgi:hypothetical protein
MPAVWNAAPARSPVFMGPSNGNIPVVDLECNTALVNESAITLEQHGYPYPVPSP